MNRIAGPACNQRYLDLRRPAHGTEPEYGVEAVLTGSDTGATTATTVEVSIHTNEP